MNWLRHSAPGSPDTKALFFLFYEQVQIMMTAGQSEIGILVTWSACTNERPALRCRIWWHADCLPGYKHLDNILLSRIKLYILSPVSTSWHFVPPSPIKSNYKSVEGWLLWVVSYIINVWLFSFHLNSYSCYRQEINLPPLWQWHQPCSANQTSPH